MSEQKHTRGPWRLGIAGYSSTPVLSECPCHLVADVARWDGSSRAESEANARLVAAAPDLLEACKAALDSALAARKHDCPGYDCATCASPMGRLRDAIDKAEGW